jgi:glycine cleavage system H protein
LLLRLRVQFTFPKWRFALQFGALARYTRALFSYGLPLMSQVHADYRYVKSHEWARLEADGSVTVGISDHAQNALGELVFVELPAVGKKLSAGATAAVVESVKAASDVYAPIAGTVTAINTSLSDAPETLNADCYDKGWMFKLTPDSTDSFATLLDAKAYEATLG